MSFESCSHDTAFLTFRTYGTWLPGDKRGWVARDGRGSKSARPKLEAHCRKIMRQPPMVLSSSMRSFVDTAIRGYCLRRGWRVLALSVRSNHIHLLLLSDRPAFKAMAQIKAAVTAALRAAGLIASDRLVFARGGSCRGCYSPIGVDRVRVYIEFGQDDVRRHTNHSE